MLFLSEELVSEIQERARESKKNAMKEANATNPNHKNNRCGSNDPQPSIPKTNTATKTYLYSILNLTLEQ